eukprot:TRINITY_DN18383_c0_g1_i1.p1 TRINITY_DN18383_c0_g1~~TRINITY_DN18383_c0_g1_i1.p1  ORF type:complete len:143 (+),score=21.85 TRINITY_DN18383_c0_g1_i1:73-501(+)
MSKRYLFEDIFEVKAIDKDGNHFDKVSRFECRGESFEVDLTLDINIDIYKLEVNQKFTMVLVSSLDDEQEQGYYKYNRGPSLLDKFEYCMMGKVFKTIKEEKSSKLSVHVSFGGLLMLMQGDQRHLQDLELDARIYLLIRKS